MKMQMKICRYYQFKAMSRALANSKYWNKEIAHRLVYWKNRAPHQQKPQSWRSNITEKHIKTQFKRNFFHRFDINIWLKYSFHNLSLSSSLSSLSPLSAMKNYNQRLSSGRKRHRDLIILITLLNLWQRPLGDYALMSVSRTPLRRSTTKICTSRGSNTNRWCVCVRIEDSRFLTFACA